jgi:hypothetical protein
VEVERRHSVEGLTKGRIKKAKHSRFSFISAGSLLLIKYVVPLLSVGFSNRRDKVDMARLSG